MGYFKILFQRLCLISALAFWLNWAFNKLACRVHVFKLFSSFPYLFKVFPNYLKASQPWGKDDKLDDSALSLSPGGALV